MTCTIKVKDVPDGYRGDFSRGVHQGRDMAHRRPTTTKDQARFVIYAGMERSYDADTFWQYQGALTGIMAATGRCPHCGSAEECRGPWR